MKRFSTAFVVLLAGVVAAVATPAQAEVRSGASDGGGVLAASFDDTAGSLLLTVSAPAGTTAEFRGQMKTYCSEFAKPADSAGEEIPVDLVLSEQEAISSGGELGQATVSTLPSGSGQTVQATYTTAAFIDRGYRCLEGTVGGTPVLLYFDGFRHQKLTAAAALAAVKADLVAKYGITLAGKPTYLACPAKRVTDAALCRYQLGRGALVRNGTYIVDETEVSLGVTRVRALTYSQKGKKCAAKYQRDEQFGARVVIDKKLTAPSVLCSSTLVRFLLTKSVAAFPGKARAVTFNQTPAAGFEPLSRYACKPGAVGTRYAWVCTNKLGDRVSFTFTVARKDAVKKR